MDRDLAGVTTSQLNSQFRYKLVDLSTGDVTDLTPNWTHYGKSQDGNIFTGSRVYSKLMSSAGSDTTSTSKLNLDLRVYYNLEQFYLMIHRLV